MSRHVGSDEANAARVQEAVSDVRRRWLLAGGLRAATEAALGLTVTLAVVSTAAAGGRLGAATAVWIAAASAVLLLAFTLWRLQPLRRRPHDRQVARLIEERAPHLDEVLVSAVDSRDKPSSSLLTGFLLADAANRLDGLDLDRVVPRQTIRRRGLELAGALGLLVAVTVLVSDPLLRVWGVLRMAVAPPQLTFEVDPGDVELREGDALRVRARVTGLPSHVPPEDLGLVLERAGLVHDVAMAPAGGWHEAVVEDARAAFSYRVSGYGATSIPYHVGVRPRPRVERIDLHLEFPAFSGLMPRVDEDAGDIYAPAGTRVRWVVHTNVPISEASVGLTSGGAVGLAATAAGTLEGQMAVTRDDAYRLTLVEDDGQRTPDETEYFVRIVEDRPPDVRIVAPASDRKVTLLEEVTIEARAQDDFGIDRLELVYAARGAEERAVRIGSGGGATVDGRYTLFVEDLDVQPGDFVTYYARATDVARGKRPTEVRSDIFFLEVRPFNEEFEAAPSAAMAAGAAGSAFDDLAERQKELVVATWKIERRAEAGRSAEDIRALARVQGELKEHAERLAQRMTPRVVPRRPGEPLAPPDRGALGRAVDAMERSRVALEALRTGQAIPHEMTALNELLRAQAEIQRRQVAQQQAGGGRGQTGNQDLSALFDQELQRQQQTNYENRSSTRQEQEEEGSEALERLRELARRQDELARQQQELSRRQAQLAAEELRRQLERLTREQEELRRQAEQLAAEMRRQSGESSSGQQAEGEPQGNGSAQGEAVRAAAEAMRQSAGGLGRQQAAEAAAQAAQAAERLRQAEQALGRQGPDEASRAAGDLRLEAAQLAENERRVARQLRQDPAAGRDELRQLAGEQERLADRAARLAERARAIERGGGEPSDVGPGARDSLTRSLAGSQVESELRDAARALRQLAEAGSAGESTAGQRREADRADGLARLLEGAARELGRTAGSDRSAELSEQLARAGELGDRLGELTRRLEEGAGPQGAAEGERQAAGGRQPPAPGRGQLPSQSGAGREGQAAGGDRSQSASPQQGASGNGDGSPSLDEVQRELRALGRLTDGLGEEGAELRDALQALEGYAPSRSAPGTEAWKQDFSRWEALRRQIAASLEQFSARVSEALQAQQRQDRLDAGANEEAPDSYRREVERYYRSLARRPPS
jgi:hypothetical protein